MNRDESEMIVTRMSQAWKRHGAFGEEWHDALADLDFGKAGTAFVRLRNSEEHPPSIAKFRAACGSVQGDTVNVPKCPHCDGTGMVAPSIDAWGSESDPCEFCDLGKLQAERIRSPQPEGIGRLTERECNVGLANVDQCMAIMREQRTRGLWRKS